MSYMLPHLTNGWQVDQAIQHEEDKVGNFKFWSDNSTRSDLHAIVQVVCVRFGHDWDPTCMKMDETLYSGKIHLNFLPNYHLNL